MQHRLTALNYVMRGRREAGNFPIDRTLLPHFRSKGRQLSAKSTPTEVTDQALAHEVWIQRQEAAQRGQAWEPQPRGVLCCLLNSVEAVYLAGGGGAGRAYAAAFEQAGKFGLNLNNVTVVNATSVGAIQGLMIALGYQASEMKEQLRRVRANTFQDWDVWSVLKFFKKWGVCRGEAMEEYFKWAIKRKTGLSDPTFRQLHEAGFTKDFRVFATNVSRRKMVIFSYRETPDVKVAFALALACRIPLIYPPTWIKNERGEVEAYADGGIAQNYPYGIACEPDMPLSKQLGFMFLQNSENPSVISSFWGYLYNLAWTMFFQTPLSFPEWMRWRTVYIETGDHSILEFTANLEQQAKLDACGRQGVKNFIKDLIQRRLKDVPMPKNDLYTTPSPMAYYRAKGMAWRKKM